MIVDQINISVQIADHMENAKLNVSCAYDEDEQILVHLLFTIVTKDFRAVFETSTPHCVSVEQVKDFLTAVKNQSIGFLKFDCSNDPMSVETIAGKTSFTVSRYGDHNGGELCSFTLMNTACVDAFEQLLETYEKLTSKLFL